MRAIIPVRYLREVVFVLAAVLVGGLPAHGQGVPGYPEDVRYGYDPREVAMLPRYCIYTQLFNMNVPGGNNPDEIKRWYSLMGSTFHHMHHYCWGLMKTNRALFLVRTERWRKWYLDSSLVEFDYVIRNATADFKLLPEILTKKGENLIRLGRGTDGVSTLKSAIQLKPDYWPAYAAMSDYYRTTGDLAKARESLEEGLSASPNTKALIRRLAELKVPQGESKADSAAER